MKKSLLTLGALGSMVFAAPQVFAQDEVIVAEETVTVQEIPCKTHYYTDSSSNWFIQLGAGVNSPFVENLSLSGEGHGKHQLTAVYNFGFGKWISPYIGWRASFLGGALHWQDGKYSKAKYVSANVDFMWDMFNSYKVNPRRVFSIIPFVGLGGTYSWDFRGNTGNIIADNGKLKHCQWTLPVSAGLQFRFRLCRYVDFFAEARAQFYGDNFNNLAYGAPVDIDITAIGGFSFNIGGSDFQSYNPCDYIGYINTLNNQVNDLRAELAGTAAALAAAEAQLPCPEVQAVVEEVQPAPLMATVRFRINKDVITPEEQVNVYNVAEWLKANPGQTVVIAGYADRDTGTSAYNMGLSKRRAQAVYDMLTNTYGIDPARLSISAYGSDVQPYDTNNWNRIVIFSNN